MFETYYNIYIFSRLVWFARRDNFVTIQKFKTLQRDASGRELHEFEIITTDQSDENARLGYFRFDNALHGERTRTLYASKKKKKSTKLQGTLRNRYNN